MVKRFKMAIPMAMAMLVISATAAFAQDLNVVVSAKKLLDDASTWLLGLIPSASGAALGYHAMMKQMSDGDPAVLAARNKSMKNVLVGGAIGTSAVGLVKGILAYFG